MKKIGVFYQGAHFGNDGPGGVEQEGPARSIRTRQAPTPGDTNLGPQNSPLQKPGAPVMDDIPAPACTPPRPLLRRSDRDGEEREDRPVRDSAHDGPGERAHHAVHEGAAGAARERDSVAVGWQWEPAPASGGRGLPLRLAQAKRLVLCALPAAEGLHDLADGRQRALAGELLP